LQQQASQLLTNPDANQGRVDQQARQLLAQGLKDISGKNETYGILELMKGAAQKPELVQDQRFIEGLKQAVGDVHPHIHAYPLDAQQMQSAMQGQNAGLDGRAQQQQQPSDTTLQSKPATATEATATAAPGSDVSSQLVQQGLSAIAGGDKMSGIMALIQAAQLNPGIMNDSRFVNALQAALTQGAGKSTASATDRPGATSLESQAEQSLAVAKTANSAGTIPQLAIG
jgi:predicted lipid-binding transport protein (Tim44 family)